MSCIRQLLIGCAMVVLTACGGGGGGGGFDNTNTGVTTPVAPTGANVHPMTVGSGPGNNVNMALTSVQVCVAGNSSQCVTLDNILVDTGSVGLRVLSSALTSLPLDQQLSANGNPLLECVQFVDNSHVWGPVKIADVKFGTEIASAARIQLIGNPTNTTEPTACNGGDLTSNLDTLAKLGANGILGVGQFSEDCGLACTFTNPQYFACPSSGCISTTAAINIQVQNPVAHFASDNNGVIIQLPSVVAAGATSISGWLIFGIDTQSNNALGSAKVLTVNNSGYLGTTYKGTNYPQSFVDSGSNGLYFPDNTIQTCSFSSDFYCPTSTLNLSATMTGANSASSVVNFSVGDAGSLGDNIFVVGNFAGPAPSSMSFDWGLPFFFGRKVYTAFENNSAGPYIAF